MTFRSPYERRLGRRRTLTRALLVAALLVVCLWLDGPVYRLLSVQYTPTRELAAQSEGLPAAASAAARRKAHLEDKDWYQMFRAAGYLPTWLFIGGAVWLAERARRRGNAAGLVIVAGALASGLAAEVLKPLIGRHRPALDGSLEWNPLLGRLLQPDTYDAALGLPSSHAAVAFGAAFVVLRLYPASGWLAVAAATGCALTRLLAGAHVLSDVVLAALVAWMIAAVLARLLATDRRRAPARFD
jgi:membrane-associated phospholipid phosphatase